MTDLAAMEKLLCGGQIFFLELMVDKKRAERQESSDKNHPGFPEREARGLHGNNEHGTKCQKKKPVSPTNDLHGILNPRPILQWHGDAEEDEKGNSLENGHEAKAADGCFKHG